MIDRESGVLIRLKMEIVLQVVFSIKIIQVWKNQLPHRKPCGYLLRKYPSAKSNGELNPIMIKLLNPKFEDIFVPGNSKLKIPYLVPEVFV